MKNRFQPPAAFFPADAGVETDLLGELGRATTAYFEATPDRLELARQEYELALGRFQGSISDSPDTDES